MHDATEIKWLALIQLKEYSAFSPYNFNGREKRELNYDM